jgi:hypothetical protein
MDLNFMPEKEKAPMRLQRNQAGKLEVVGDRIENTKVFAAGFLGYMNTIGDIIAREYPNDDRVAMKLVKLLQMDGDFAIGEAAAAALTDPEAKRALMPRSMRRTLGPGILMYQAFGSENDLRLVVRKNLTIKQGGAAAQRNTQKLVQNAKEVIHSIKSSGEAADVDVVWTNARLHNLNLLFSDGTFTPDEMRALFDRAEWGFDNLVRTHLWDSVLSLIPGGGAHLRFPGKKGMQKIVSGALEKILEKYDINEVRKLMANKDEKQEEIPFLLLLAESLRAELSKQAGKELPLNNKKVLDHTTGNILQTLFAATETSFAAIKRMIIALKDKQLFAELKAEALAALPEGIDKLTPQILMRGDNFPKLIAKMHDIFRTPPTPLDQRVNIDPETGRESTTYIGLKAMTELQYRQQIYTTFRDIVSGEWFGNVGRTGKTFKNPRECPGATWAITEIMATILAILLETNGVELTEEPVEFEGVTSTPRNVKVKLAA